MAADLSRRRPLLFFFQAEDGIRDRNVTGVQTCALPICMAQPIFAGVVPVNGFLVANNSSATLYVSDVGAATAGGASIPIARSEERRVGKECRSGGRPYD